MSLCAADGTVVLCQAVVTGCDGRPPGRDEGAPEGALARRLG